MKTSIVIPTKDAGAAFSGVLSQLRDQIFDSPFEILVIDSGSSDGTVERAMEAGARTHRIAASEFNHGRVRNLGVELSDAEAIAFLSQDARPTDAYWLARLTQSLGERNVVGVSGRVVPRPNASPLVARSVRADFAYSRERSHREIKDREVWRHLPPAQKRTTAHFNNVSSCALRSVLCRLPFPEFPFGEDLAWAVQILEAGLALVHEPEAVVVHSHPSALQRDFRRHRADAQLLRALFGLRPSILEEAQATAGSIWRDWQVLGQGSGWPERVGCGLYSPMLRSSQALGRVLGSRGRMPAGFGLAPRE